MTSAGPCCSLRTRCSIFLFSIAAALFFIAFSPCALGQQTLGAITGTVTDPSGAVVSDAAVKAVNLATNLEIVAHTKANGSFLIPDLPDGTYRVIITKEGFKTETHTKILVFGNRTTTVDTSLVVGSTSATVEVTAVPLMNQVDTTIGYVVDTQTIETTPLGTGSFTQLAILSPGVHADFLGGGGANTGLGNQAIFANGNRDTSNHPDFDTPNNDVNFFPNYEGPPSLPPQGSLGVIQHTIGSPRFLQLAMHFTF